MKASKMVVCRGEPSKRGLTDSPSKSFYYFKLYKYRWEAASQDHLKAGDKVKTPTRMVTFRLKKLREEATK
jgi:hypothetical protein